MSGLKGVYITKKKDGSTHYRSSITYKNKHISLGSYASERLAHEAYLASRQILIGGESQVNEFDTTCPLDHDKWVILHNYRDNGYYFKTPIYLRKRHFIYYLNQGTQLFFDVDDLFYYSSHPIHSRGGYLFVNDYGMQVNILNRYGIQNHTIEGRDYRFIDGDSCNLRYDNIEVMNPYHGIYVEKKETDQVFKARVNLNGYYTIGRYKDLDTAAIAYNKAVDFVQSHNITVKQFEKNYIAHMKSEDYKQHYEKIKLPKKIRDLKGKTL